MEGGGAGGRRAGAGNAGTATSADAVVSSGAAPAGPAPGGPAGQVHHLGFGAPAPYLGDGPQGQAWCGFNTDLHNPAADPPPGEVEAHLRADPHRVLQAGGHQVVKRFVDPSHVGDDAPDQRVRSGQGGGSGAPAPALFHLLG